MVWNPELDRLKAEQQTAFERKQEAYQRYAEAKQRTQQAHDIMQEAWQERQIARIEMNREYEARQAAFDRNDAIWNEYKRIRDNNNYQLEYLRHDADAEHQAMIDCFEAASAAYESGDRAAASLYSSEGHDHKDRRDSLNAEVSALVQEIKDAKAHAESAAPKVDQSAFYAAKERFTQAKTRHQAAETDFKREKAERDRLRAEFNHLQQEFLQAKEAFQRKRDEIKAEKQARRDKVESALMSVTGRFDGKAAKIIDRDDGSGKTDVYFGGSNPEGDGLGHGHAIIKNGQVVYLRGQYQDHEDWLINEDADIPDKHGRIRFPGEHTKIWSTKSQPQGWLFRCSHVSILIWWRKRTKQS